MFGSAVKRLTGIPRTVTKRVQRQFYWKRCLCGAEVCVVGKDKIEKVLDCATKGGLRDHGIVCDHVRDVIGKDMNHARNL